MIVHLLVEYDGDDGYWVVDACDEYTVDEWGGGYPTEFETKLKQEDVDRRILQLTIPDDALSRPWKTATATGVVRGS